LAGSEGDKDGRRRQAQEFSEEYPSREADSLIDLHALNSRCNLLSNLEFSDGRIHLKSPEHIRKCGRGASQNLSDTIFTINVSHHISIDDMKTLLTKLSLLSLVLMMGLASCTEEEGGATNTISNLSATARSATSIGVRWENGTASDSVVVTAVGGTTPVIVAATAAGEFNKAVVNGLTVGTDYTISVRNANGTSSSITYSPATRWPADGSTVRLYSTAAPASVGPSGLIIENTGIRVVSTESAADSNSIDVVLGWNDNAAKPVSLVSPGVEGSGVFNGMETKFISPFLVAGGLNEDYYTGSIVGLFTAGPTFNAVDVETLSAADAAKAYSLIAPFRSTAGGEVHYGRIELVPQAATGQPYGVLVVGGKQYEFVDVKVSYQSVANSGYVGRPQAPGHFPRRAAGPATVKN
jgi:hypothetical protein